MNEIKGMIFNIAKFSINDGPGIRTSVFLKGCPLTCSWCHNPESKSSSPQIMYYKNKCINCGQCAKVCENGCHSMVDNIHIMDLTNCTMCQHCSKACDMQALLVCGYEATIDEIVINVIKDKSFYETSNGGATITGGEPFLQIEFTTSLLEKLKSDGIHTCIETSGYRDMTKTEKLVELTDLFLLDYKHYDAFLLKKYTAIDMMVYEKNLEYLYQINKPVIMRCPIIPSINDNFDHCDSIIKTANRYNNIYEINIMPYHDLGKSKSESLQEDINDDFRLIDEDRIKEFRDYIQKHVKQDVKIL